MLENIVGFEDYFAYCGNQLPADFTPWKHSTTRALMGLEQFGWSTMLPYPGNDGRVGVGLLVRVAQTAFPLVAAVGGQELSSAAFFADHDAVAESEADGAPLETQLATLMSWLDEDADEKAVAAVYDRTRQLYVWDDDIRPSYDQSFMWLTEVGQCACAALMNEDGDPNDRGYYGWPPGACVGRGLVATIRALTPTGADVAGVYDKLFKPLQEKPQKPRSKATTEESSSKNTAVRSPRRKPAKKK